MRVYKKYNDKEDNTNSAGPPCKRLKQAQLTLFASKPSKLVEPAASKPSSSACSSNDGDSAIVDVIMHPNQPRNREFPAKVYGGKNRRFKETYFVNHKWLHWEETEQSVYCHPCCSDHFRLCDDLKHTCGQQ